MNEKDEAEVFGDFDPDLYKAEAEARWGRTEAFKESRRRTRGYTKADWLAIKAESAAIEAGLAASFDSGAPAASPAAMEAAEKHRRQINDRFYPCSPEMHSALGRMLADDPRFAAHYEKIRPGLAVYVRDAILSNAVRLSKNAGA
jgi:MerR family transcriptional regulator, thiopeptide resistance regulator